MPKHPPSPPFRTKIVSSGSKNTSKHMITIPKPIMESQWQEWKVTKTDSNQMIWVPDNIDNIIEKLYNQIKQTYYEIVNGKFADIIENDLSILKSRNAKVEEFKDRDTTIQSMRELFNEFKEFANTIHNIRFLVKFNNLNMIEDKTSWSIETEITDTDPEGWKRTTPDPKNSILPTHATTLFTIPNQFKDTPKLVDFADRFDYDMKKYLIENLKNTVNYIVTIAQKS